MYNLKELSFEILEGNVSIDMFGTDFVVSFGTSNNDDDISEDNIDHIDIPKFFIGICENVLTLTDGGKDYFDSIDDVKTWLIGIGLREN